MASRTPADAAGAPPPGEAPEPLPPISRVRLVKRAIKIFLALFALALLWLIVTAPLSRSLGPVDAPSITILSAEGEPIARRGATIEAPVDVMALPPYVGQAFISIEDRRFFHHVGIDPWGMGRALLRDIRAGRLREGGSTISQQLAKTSFLSPDRTPTRKIQEALIALWLEARLSKEEILSRYLSNVGFGDNVYGLRAAAHHYFNVDPEHLTLAQAAMLAGVVNAPSRLAPSSHLDAARDRAELVLNAMHELGFLTDAQRAAVRPARLHLGPRDDVPTGTYFADWVLPQAADLTDDGYGQRHVQTTLEGDLQRLAVRSIRRAGLGRAQAALVAMRLDGRVVAMVGGKDYAQSPFNRAVQARRQPGSAFKLFVYLAAFRHGLTPSTPVNDVPIRVGDWSPQNYGGSYRGPELLRDAVAYSSNSVAVQISERVGRANVIRAARDLGITTPLRPDPSLPLGVNNVTLLELTSAYAAVAAGRYPIRPHGLPPESTGWFGWGSPDRQVSRDRAFPMLRDVLYAVVQRGTGRAAALSVPTFGKTGTTSDYRDAWFVGFAGDLVVGVWVGNDDNRPMPGTTGGTIPARIWHAFMAEALGATAPPPQQTNVPLYKADQENANAPVDRNATQPAPEPEAPPPPDVPEVAAPPPTAPKVEAPPPTTTPPPGQ
ncbi:MAG: transglycosylase domain-containing protein [Sphingomonadaceae bacterium]|nr:transglycosylase domain-containing protein [Sphingomonadaceae bacterium]